MLRSAPVLAVVPRKNCPAEPRLVGVVVASPGLLLVFVALLLVRPSVLQLLDSPPVRRTFVLLVLRLLLVDVHKELELLPEFELQRDQAVHLRLVALPLVRAKEGLLQSRLCAGLPLGLFLVRNILQALLHGRVVAPLLGGLPRSLLVGLVIPLGVQVLRNGLPSGQLRPIPDYVVITVLPRLA